MIWLCIGILIIVILWFVCMTPWPFVLLLRHKKEEPREKGRSDQKQIEEHLTIKKGLPYPSTYPSATYDVYYDPNTPAKRVMVWVHGGAFIAGDSRGTKNFGPMMAKQGTIFYAINYALAPAHHFPDQILQIDEFLKELPQLLSKEGLPMPSHLYLGGDSAGANMVAEYACMKYDAALCEKSHVQLQSCFDIHGLLLYCGPYDFAEDLTNPKLKDFVKMFHYLGWAYLGKKSWAKHEEKYLASPYHQVNRNFPATYLCDGRKYSFLWQGKKLAEKLSDMQVYVKSDFYEDMPHEFQFDYVKYPKEAMEVFENSCAFMENIERKQTC